MTKFQVPTIGGIRKVIKQSVATTPGTTIAEVGSGTISLSQLAQYVTQIQAAQQNNTQSAGDDIYIVVGPGLAGGGSVGIVPIRLTAPIPYFGGEDGADGADGPPGATGNAGATGPAGVGVMGPPGDDGADGADGPPGLQGNQGPQGLQGSTGPAGVGVQGQAGDDGADGDLGPPGATGPRGATGQNGSQGVAGPALYLMEDATNDDGFCYPFGGTATATSGSGTVEPFNITPDAHPVTPTGVGLGPNDEFETGSTIDTAGTRYSSATAWTAFNATGLTTSISEGALILSNNTNTTALASGYSQPISGNTTWQYTVKVATGGTGLIGIGLATASGSSGNISALGLAVGTGFVVQHMSNASTFTANAYVGGAVPNRNGLGHSSDYNYLQIYFDGTNINYQVSATGVPGTYVTVFSETPAAFLGTVTQIIVSVGSPVVCYGVFDYFRQTA